MVDNNNTFKKGSWYLTKINGKYQYYIKFSHQKGDEIHSSEYINYNYNGHGITHTYDRLCNVELNEVNISEIAHLLSPNHPDLLLLHSSENLLSKLIIW